MKVLPYDPYISLHDFQKAAAEPVSLKRAISEAGFITLHTPLTAETLKRSRAVNKPKKLAIFVLKDENDGRQPESGIGEVAFGQKKYSAFWGFDPSTKPNQDERRKRTNPRNQA